MVNPKEQVQAITTRSGVQLPEIHVKRPERKNKEIMGKEAGTEAESEQPNDKGDERKETNVVRAPSPVYTKFLKEILSNKRKLEEHQTICPNEECSAILLRKLPPKLKDPRSFTIPCTIGSNYFEQPLCDLGANVNLMPLSVYRPLGLEEAKPTTISLQLADRSIKRLKGIIEDVLVKLDRFIFSADFIILDMEEDSNIPLFWEDPSWLLKEC
ncbi:uncharacterized protein LOC111366399 [Olea europaea var. sylvestris]|uniref:uncharacterized protein LOC111366399 n=1 Tax=Olea europaea var. sylvestris TaxID=158386 RepID=UPI000C1D0C81|nr:uncharacterized protein LOC111366399 [Olea europaea var. sylvestris]